MQVQGHRVELAEVEAVLREVAGTASAVVLPMPYDSPSVEMLCAFVVDEGTRKVGEIRQAMARKLPDYMVPSRVSLISELPLTANGKFDRRALAAQKKRDDA